MQHDPKSVLVTGAGSGIGRALAIEAARRGNRVALVGRRGSALLETANLLESSIEPLLIPADLTSADDRRKIVAKVAEDWGGLHVLINNAGVVSGGPLESVADDEIDTVLETNIAAPIQVTRDFLSILKRSRPSRVVNIGSVFGDIGYPDFAAHSASKYALRGFSDALRRELHGTGVEVTYCAPRATRTDAAVAFDDLIVQTKMKLDVPEVVAQRIWSGIEAGKHRIYPAGPERIFVLIEKLFPSMISRALAAQRSTSATTSPLKDAHS